MIDATGERYVPGQMVGLIENEHLHRYSFAKDICKNRVVLDVASGEGYGAHLLSMVSDCVIGIDVDLNSTLHAHLSYANDRDNLFFLNAGIESLPIADKAIDVVVSFETIEHIQDQESMVAECARVLKDDGLFLVSTPNKEFYSEKPFYNNAYHVKELDRDQFLSLLSKKFKYIELYNQSIVCPSMIRSERVKENSTVEIESGGANNLFPYQSAEFNSTYYLALCSNNQISMPVIKQSLLLNKNWIDIHSMVIELQKLRDIRKASAFFRPVEKFCLNLENSLNQLGFSDGRSNSTFKGSLEVAGNDVWTGWAVRSDTAVPATVVLISDGRITFVLRPCFCRPDVANSLENLAAWMSGFTLPSEFSSQLDRTNLRAVACSDGYGVGDLTIL